MKIRIENQIFDIDEDTLSEWIKLGRISADASIFFDGRWMRVGDLEGFQQPWSAENQPDIDSPEGEVSDKGSLAEKGFLPLQQSRATVTLSLIAVNTIIFLLLDEVMRGSRNALTLIQFGAYSHRLSETEEDLLARASSWKGLTDLVQSEIKSEKSQEFNRAFLNFYNRLSHRLAEDTDARAKLEAVFNLFHTHHKEG